MVPALCKANAFFDQVALRVVGEGEPIDFAISPEQARALAKALSKAAKAAEKSEG